MSYKKKWQKQENDFAALNLFPIELYSHNSFRKDTFSGFHLHGLIFQLFDRKAKCKSGACRK